LVAPRAQPEQIERRCVEAKSRSRQSTIGVNDRSGNDRGWSGSMSLRRRVRASGGWTRVSMRVRLSRVMMNWPFERDLDRQESCIGPRTDLDWGSHITIVLLLTSFYMCCCHQLSIPFFPQEL
jgi:hypothetical protein